ncbi:hypothetical protein FI667_g15492, partial [Globisporangium splendens]
MAHAATENVYADQLADLLYLASVKNDQAFIDYFTNQWDACEEMWVRCYRMELLHFKNNTCSCLESLLEKMKQHVDRNLTMRECLQQLIAMAEDMEEQHNHARLQLGAHWSSSCDDEMNAELVVVADWAATQLLPELEEAINILRTCDFKTTIGECVRGTFSPSACEHSVNPLNRMSTSEFSSSMLMPCRNSIAYRKKNDHTSNKQGANLAQAQRAANGAVQDLRMTLGLPNFA